MTDSREADIRVFFSWQSDSPKQSNSGAIRAALRRATKAISKKHPNIGFVLDEATRDTSGSPNIMDKIVQKIDAAHVYVADITTVTSEAGKRPCANPNVLIELGYAVAQLGWDRVILSFNDKIANFPADLPFDIVQNRVSNYSVDPLDPEKLGGKEALESLLQVAIQAVIDKNPKTPVELRGMAPEKIRHERDVSSLRWVLSQIHIPTVDGHISTVPRLIMDKVFWFWESFKGVATNSLFHVYDPALSEPISTLLRAWGTTLAFPERYRELHSGQGHVFSNPGDAPLDPEQEEAWRKIEDAAADMAKALHALLARTRSAYLEIDINETNKKAWQEYCDFETS